MSRAQVEACAAKLRGTQAMLFRTYMQAADAAFHQSVELRRRAWAIYYAGTGDAPKLPKRRALGRR